MSKTGEIILLPRSPQHRPAPVELGFYLHVGRNHHLSILSLLAEGIDDFDGVTIDATYADRHKELISEALKRDLDVILDPQTQRSATLGGCTESIANLPWGEKRPHRLADFDANGSRVYAERIADFVVATHASQIMGPTHILQGANDPWLRADLVSMEHMREALDARASTAQLIYPLSMPMAVLRDRAQRQAILASVEEVDFDSLWLRVENFGSDATGEKTAAFIEACADLEAFDVPIIADQVAGLPGLSLLAFGAVGGIAHGVTMLDSFKPSRWRRPARKARSSGGTMPIRVYIPELDAFLKPEQAERFLKANSRARHKFGCTDSHCCPAGVRDMLNNPSRHYVYQRSKEISTIESTPSSLRAKVFVEEKVRKVSDDVASVAGFPSLDKDLKKKFSKQQGVVSGLRQVMARIAEDNPIKNPAKAPARD